MGDEEENLRLHPEHPVRSDPRRLHGRPPGGTMKVITTKQIACHRTSGGDVRSPGQGAALYLSAVIQSSGLAGRHAALRATPSPAMTWKSGVGTIQAPHQVMSRRRNTGVQAEDHEPATPRRLSATTFPGNYGLVWRRIVTIGYTDCNQSIVSSIMAGWQRLVVRQFPGFRCDHVCRGPGKACTIPILIRPRLVSRVLQSEADQHPIRLGGSHPGGPTFVASRRPWSRSRYSRIRASVAEVECPGSRSPNRTLPPQVCTCSAPTTSSSA